MLAVLHKPEQLFSCGAQSSNSTLVIFAEMLIGLDRSLKANSKELCTRETQM